MMKMMNFWLAANAVLKARGQPEMLFGEAHREFSAFKDAVKFQQQKDFVAMLVNKGGVPHV
jgi:hypothetical protein